MSDIVQAFAAIAHCESVGDSIESISPCHLADTYWNFVIVGRNSGRIVRRNVVHSFARMWRPHIVTDWRRDGKIKFLTV